MYCQKLEKKLPLTVQPQHPCPCDERVHVGIEAVNNNSTNDLPDQLSTTREHDQLLGGPDTAGDDRDPWIHADGSLSGRSTQENSPLYAPYEVDSQTFFDEARPGLASQGDDDGAVTSLENTIGASAPQSHLGPSLSSGARLESRAPATEYRICKRHKPGKNVYGVRKAKYKLPCSCREMRSVERCLKNAQETFSAQCHVIGPDERPVSISAYPDDRVWPVPRSHLYYFMGLPAMIDNESGIVLRHGEGRVQVDQAWISCQVDEGLVRGAEWLRAMVQTRITDFDPQRRHDPFIGE